MKAHGWISAGYTAFALVSFAPCATATDCRFSNVIGLNFGVYNVFSSQPNTSAVGSITIDCSKGGRDSFEVQISTGISNSYVPRVMLNGASRLEYNVYTSAARTTVAGNGQGGSSSLLAFGNSVTILNLFGLIPERQDVPAGLYQDLLYVMVIF